MSELLKRMVLPIQTKDVNLDDYIRPSSVLDYFQDIAGLHANEIGVGYQDALKKKVLWIILYEKFEVVKRVPKYGEDIVVYTWPKKGDKVFFYREYEIKDINDELLVKGVSTWCLINSETRRIERANKLELEGKYYDKENYPNKMPHHLNLKPTNVILEYQYKVLLTDLDHNEHLNNARYLDIIYNSGVYKGRGHFKDVEIAFIHEAKLNDIITLKYFKNEDNKDSFVGYVNDETIFEAILTMEE